MIVVSDFLDDVAYEVFLLRHFAEAGVVPDEAEQLNLRIKGQRIRSDMVVASFSAAVISNALKPLSGLVFGACWKIIDLLFEHAYKATSPISSQRIQIAQKTQKAKLLVSEIVICVDDQEVAERLAEIYCATSELRHALVHRRLDINNCGLTYKKQNISLDEITALSKLTLALLEITKIGFVAERARSNIHFWANQLRNVHKLPDVSNAIQLRPAPIVQINAEKRDDLWFVDTRVAWQDATQSFPYSGDWFDLEIYFPNTERPCVRCHLDAMPRSESLEVPPENPGLLWQRS